MKKKVSIIKSLILVLILAVILLTCAHTLSQIEEKWGPPAKIEKFEDRTIYYYYFQKGKGSAIAFGRGPVVIRGDSSVGWWVVELTFDKEGNLMKKREYWKQPTE
jgi:hypothetical protein